MLWVTFYVLCAPPQKSPSGIWVFVGVFQSDSADYNSLSLNSLLSRNPLHSGASILGTPFQNALVIYFVGRYWFLGCQHRCCRASRERCSNYCFFKTWKWLFPTKFPALTSIAYYSQWRTYFARTTSLRLVFRGSQRWLDRLKRGFHSMQCTQRTLRCTENAKKYYATNTVDTTVQNTL